MAVTQPDPRIDAGFLGRDVAAWIIKIVQDSGPVTKSQIVTALEKDRRGVTPTYLKHVMTRLRQFGIITVTRRNVENFAWVFVPFEPARKPSSGKVMLRHAGAYRVRTRDGCTFERLEFDRPSVTFFNRKVQLETHEVSAVAYIPDHAAFKSGAKHIDVYAHDFVPIDDCILPKRKPSDDSTPKWINPIRARALGQPANEPPVQKLIARPLPKDFGNPIRSS
jgi:hypothetical protein